jgi:A/G-specific adenine glycosylase
MADIQTSPTGQNKVFSFDRAEDVRSLQKALIRWYLSNKRNLPWRKTSNPYHIWVSEVMLQQTQVDTVVPYYNRFLKRFGSIRDLARADLQDVLKMWEGLGYYARARNLHRAAGIVLNQCNGIIPDQREDFRRLPGVGDYIAAAVLSIAFEKPYPVVDGNVKRVLARLFLMEEPVNKSASFKIFQERSVILLDPQKPGIYNQAIMELGATVCKPQRPLCLTCPVEKMCRAYQSGRVSQYPRKVAGKPTPRYQISVGVVFKNGRVLITQRKLDGLLGGLWEFPGGKIKTGEDAEAACIREIKEEVNLVVKVDSHLCRVKHAYTHFKIVMDVFCCSFVSGTVRLNGPVDHRWIKLHRIDDYPLPKANHKFIPKLKQIDLEKSKMKT